jgi:hypothetical protein
MMRRAPLAVLWALTWACAPGENHGADTDSQAPPLEPGPLGFWSESVPLATLEQQLDQLAAMQIEVNLGLTPGRVDRTELVAFVRAADAAGVRIAFWPELEVEDGRWPNARNLDAFEPWWRELIQLVEDEQLPVQTFIVDMELSILVMQQVESTVAEQGALAAIQLLLDRRDGALYEEAKARFDTLVRDAQARGFTVRLSTLPLVGDDHQDGDEDIQLLLDCPVQGIPWDEASLQVYRSIFDQYGGVMGGGTQGFDPWLVHSYALSARELFGDAAAVDLGIVGFDDWASPQDLRDDAAAAMAAGVDIGHMDVFALDQLLALDDPGAWTEGLDLLQPAIPEQDEDLEELRELIQGLDESLSVKGGS